MSNKSVIEHLEDIENKIDSKERSVSEQVGEDFNNYLKNSTLYYYEPNIRCFKSQIKSKRIWLLIFCFIFLILGIIDIYFINYRDAYGNLTDNNKMTVILIYIIKILGCLPLVLNFIYFLIQRPKKLAKSIWNKTNKEIYIFDNHLNNNKSMGFMKIFLNSLTLILVAVYFILFIANIDLISNLNNYIFDIFYLSTLFLITLIYNNLDISYSGYIYEKEDSYIVEYDNKWTKYNKN